MMVLMTDYLIFNLVNVLYKVYTIKQVLFVAHGDTPVPKHYAVAGVVSKRFPSHPISMLHKHLEEL